MSKKIEESWNKLQEIIQTPTLPLSKILNSKSLEKLPDAAWTPKSVKIRNRSHVNLPLVKIPGIPFSQIRLLFTARCQDLHIDPINSQAERFYHTCQSLFKDRKISLKDSNIGPASAKVIARLLSGNVYFSRIDLSSNKIGNKGASILTKHLRHNLAVVHLDISSNSITSEGSANVFKNLMEQESLISIDLQSHEGLNRNKLGKKGASALRDLLMTNTLISHLNIAGTSLNAKGISMLARGLEHNHRIVTLNLSNNNFTNVKDLCVALKDSSIYQLCLSHNKIADSGTNDLAGLIADHSTLYILDLSFTGISSTGLADIWTGIHRNSVLGVLKLNGNKLEEGLGREMNVAFNFNTSLKELYMNQCELNDSGVIPLYETLITNKGIFALSLAKNNISDNGVTAIASGLWKNRTLLNINLDSNRINLNGLRALLRSVVRNKDFRSISLRENNLNDDAVDLLIEVARKLPLLMNLNLEGNLIKKKDLKDLQFHLDRNKNNYNKSIVPRLREHLEHLTMDYERMQITERLIEKNRKEKQRVILRLNETEKKLKVIKEQKIESANQTERSNNPHKDRIYETSKELVFCQEQLKVSEARLKSEVHSLLNKNAHMVSELLKLEKIKSKEKEKIASKHTETATVIDKIKQELSAEERKLILATNKRDSALERLLELKGVQTPSGKPSPQKKNFYLASEKLAASKREIEGNLPRLKANSSNHSSINV